MGVCGGCKKDVNSLPEKSNSNSKSKKGEGNVVRYCLAYESEAITTKHYGAFSSALDQAARLTKTKQQHKI